MVPNRKIRHAKEDAERLSKELNCEPIEALKAIAILDCSERLEMLEQIWMALIEIRDEMTK